MRFYELALIANPELTDEGYKDLLGKIDKILKKKRKKAEKGEILREDDWGVRKLSYPINKQSKGRYIFLTISSLTDILSELERNLKLMDEVFRYQAVKLSQAPVVEEAKPEEVSTEAPAEVAAPAAAEPSTEEKTEDAAEAQQ